MDRVLEGLNILTAEDDGPSLELVLTLLRLDGATATDVTNGSTAVDLVTTQQYDAVLMDLQMPVMDGCTATRKIRESEDGGARTLIIGVTAHAMPEHHAACLDAGMDAVITKPIDPVTFAQTIRGYLDAARGSTAE